MEPFGLGDTVNIKELGRPGKIIGIWSELSGGRQYHVRYADAKGVLHTLWMDRDSLEAAIPEPAGA